MGSDELILQELVDSMIYTWGSYDMSFADKPDFQNAQSYVPNGFIELVFLKRLNAFEAVYSMPFSQVSQSFVWGQTKYGNRIALTGTGNWFEVKLYPWAFHLLFGHSANSLPPGATSFIDLNKDFERLSEQIALCQSGRQALQTFKKFAVKQLRSAVLVKPFLIHSFNLLYGSHGQVKISEICGKVNVSRQHFHQYFKETIGLSPKYYAKIIRLRYTVDSIYNQPGRSLTQIALDAGYFDQAHFIRDFKLIMGQTPKSFFKQKQFIFWDL